jgi:hypothetical protein
MRRLPIRALLVVVVACGGGDHEVPPNDRAERAQDARRLLDAMAEADTERILAEVDVLVADDRPVLASERVAQDALPAVDRQVAAVERVPVSTARGRTMRDRLREALAARRDALDHYALVLGRGLIEDEALLSVIHEQRVADERLGEVHRALLSEFDGEPVPEAAP